MKKKVDPKPKRITHKWESDGGSGKWRCAKCGLRQTMLSTPRGYRTRFHYPGGEMVTKTPPCQTPAHDYVLIQINANITYHNSVRWCPRCGTVATEEVTLVGPITHTAYRKVGDRSEQVNEPPCQFTR